MPRDIGFAVQAHMRGAASWVATAQRAEAAGFETLLVADHPGSTASPFVALGAAASVTSTIGLGSYVLNAGVRDPLHIAADAATLDVVSNGRAILGIGSGHTPAEWSLAGLEYPDARGRIDHLLHTVERVQALLRDQKVHPRPVQPSIPLLMGGGNRRLLAYAVEHADVVALSGLGRTLPDGHSHEVRWTEADVDALIARVRAARRLDVLVQHVEITDDRAGALANVLDGIASLTLDGAMACPFLLVGTEDELVAQVRAHRDRWGITRFTVRADAIDAIAPVIARL